MLYDTLNQIGKEKIHIELNKDFSNSKKIILTIMQTVISKFKYSKIKNLDYFESNDKNKKYEVKKKEEDQPIVLCEALLHFLLTASAYPSQRKILLNNQEIDIVIPDLRTLKSKPKKSLIIKFYKASSSLEDLKTIERIQPHTNNIWIVSTLAISSKYRNYVLYTNRDSEKNNIIYSVKDNLNEKDRNINDFQNVDAREEKDDAFPLGLDTKDFSNILIDIYMFLKETNNKSFKFIHI
jgi:hypothetical protein